MGLSVVTSIVGLVLLFMGVTWIWFRGAVEGEGVFHFIYTLGEWNDYILVIGLIILGIGLYYIYSYLKNRKFVLGELTTNKRSEYLKKRLELQRVVKRLPSKYQQMVKEKEKDLKIK
jgi:hypothetical protein